MVKRKGWIEPELYAKIAKVMPLLCVDLIIRRPADGRILLTRRTVYPAKGKWWVPGGRVYKGEKLSDAVDRKAKEEVGLSIRQIRCLGPVEFFFRKGMYSHAIATVYLVEPINEDIILDDTASRYRWVKKLPKHLAQYSSLLNL